MPKTRISKSNLLYYLFHPATFALYFWIGSLILAPNYFHKYSAEIIQTRLLGEGTKYYSHNLGDGPESEQIKSLHNFGANIPSVSYFDKDSKIINQWNLRGNWLIFQKLFFGDFNSNGYQEVYCLTRVNDSIFLNAKEVLLEGGLEIKDRFICRTNYFNGTVIDVHDVNAKNIDINGDGISEFIFTISTGFSLQPRNTFAYDIINDSIFMSPISASGFSGGVNYLDIDGDGIDEITGFTAAVENNHTNAPYTDSCSWLMVLNPKNGLNFQFPPIKYNGAFSSLSPEFYKIGANNYIVCIYTCQVSGSLNNGSLIQLYNSNGELLKEKVMSYENYETLTPINPRNGNIENIYLIDNLGNILVSDTSFNFRTLSSPKNKYLQVPGLYYLLDTDNDGDKELLFISQRPSPEKLIIYRSSLKESTIVDLPESEYTKHWYATIKQNGIGEQPEIVLQTDNVVYTIRYSKSKYFILKYPTYLGLYLLLFVIFWGLQKAQNVVARRNLEKEKHLMRQQMALSKRQLEPHFMLNTLNNIGYMFSKENKEDAQYYFQRFASLIHRGLKYADQTETSLFEELEFVRDYLILQQKRFNDDFDFLIESDENIDLNKIQIPHSLIYTFVENAIKHGLRPKDGDKQLEIILSKTETKTRIVITDNGVGRKQSKSLKTTGTEKGLKIIASIVEGYNKLNNRSISYDIEDLVNDNNKGIGTVITIIT